MSYLTKSQKEAMSPIEVDLCIFAENNDALFMEDLDTVKHILHLKFSRDEFPVDLHYDENYPNSKYYITIPSEKLTKEYEHYIERFKLVTEINASNTLSDVLNSIIKFKKDEDANKQKAKTDPNEIRKR